MPRFNESLKLKCFEDVLIPETSKRAVMGSSCGVYFFWKGKWWFTVISGIYVDPCNLEDGDFIIDDFIGNNKIVELK